MLDAVRRALVDALKVPEDDPLLRLVEYRPDHFIVPTRHHTDRCTLVEITMFKGRSAEAKRRLYQAIVANLGRVGVGARDVVIVLHEPPMENWGIEGGTPANEVDVGFQVEI